MPRPCFIFFDHKHQQTEKKVFDLDQLLRVHTLKQRTMSLLPGLHKRYRNASDEENRPLKKSNSMAVATTPLGQLVSLISDCPHITIPQQGSITIGRSRQCDVLLKGSDISTKHCQLTPVYNEVTNNTYLNIVDLSSNGTFVNGARISNKLVLLKDGDKVDFAKTGSYVFKYEKNEYNKENATSVVQSGFNDEYILGKELGSGHYATVNEAINRNTGNRFAVKIFKPQKIDDAKRSQKFNQELNVLMSIQHENIVKLIDRYIEPINKFSVTTYLVLEKVNSGELFTRIVKKTHLRENEAKAMFRQLLKGLKYLHDRDIIHRDIKPENILLNIIPRTTPEQVQTGPWDPEELDVSVKIADFGLAKFIGEMNFTNTLCGTPSYVAPEVLSSGNERKYSKNVDLWSSGVLLYVCLAGFPPFSDELGPPSMREQIINAKYAFYSPYFDPIDDLALDFISRLLVKDPAHRYSVNQALAHPWFDTDKRDQLQLSKNVQRSPVKGQPPRTYTELSKMESIE